ncbi:MAG: holo-[acyl-carrier-protein] synthase [Chloroflexi bacterium RBG_13_50_10]|jgi:holo-[acyl-carrier protein] synthase|nr:MAG: holo-[acyl-carrier-protein] synthase [Chloroflexi bacterium RBG_13_50_10]
MSPPRASVGTDIIEIHRIEQAILSWQDSFLRRIYTQAELQSCHNRASSLAARFAAKEAVMKALGSGASGVKWRDIEILSDSEGAPVVQLHARARRKAEESGIAKFSVTMSHCKEYAVAVVIGDAI